MKKLTLITLLALVVGFEACAPRQSAAQQPIEVNAENALQSYLNTPDTHYQWEMNDTFEMDGGKGYELILTSQQWREHIWKHQLTVFVPDEVTSDAALLFISGGSNKDSSPNLRSNQDDLSVGLTSIAVKNQSIVALIRQVPNQPFYDGRTEDALISYTLHQFNETGDFTWPLLFPMVKSVVRGMDAVQAFAEKQETNKINRFVLSGLSKRGWTTWLTSANDDRVVALAPMVIDVLNMPKSLQYQIDAWKDYSIEIQDYVSLGIPQQAETGEGRQIVQMVDPYSYRKTLDKPKMIFNGTNDPYWPVDAIKNYLDSIPGENRMHYVPNAGHGLGDMQQAFAALNAFYGFTIAGEGYPVCDWEIDEKNGEIHLSVRASAGLKDAIVWVAKSEDQDFRDEQWESQSLNASGKMLVEFSLSYPEKGFEAFYIDLRYESLTGDEFVQSTRMFVSDTEKVLLH